MSNRRRSLQAAPPAGLRACIALAGALVLPLPASIAAQQAETPPFRTTEADPDDRRSRWRAGWEIATATEYDANVFKLTSNRMEELESGGSRYADMESASDAVTSVGLEGELRGRALFGRRLSVRGTAGVDVHALNPRRTHADFGVRALQSLSSRDKLGVELAFTPSEFRRNYLAGADGAGDPVYAAGVHRSVDGSISYRREVLEGKGPRRAVDLELSALGMRRTVRDFPWRDRSEIGGEAELDVEIARWLDVELSGARVRAFHDGSPEPVRQLVGVTMQSLERDFWESVLGVETSFRLSGDARLLFDYQWSHRDYLAEEASDPVYGGRVSRRHTFGGELRLDLSRNLTGRFGGAYQLQDLSRPTTGGTGDEEDFRRPRVFLKLVYSR